MKLAQKVENVILESSKDTIHDNIAGLDEELRKKTVDFLLYSDEKIFGKEGFAANDEVKKELIDYFRKTREEQLSRSIEKYHEELIRGGDIVRMGLTVLTTENYKKIFSLIPANLCRSFCQFFESDEELDDDFYNLYGKDTIDAVNFIRDNDCLKEVLKK